MNGHSTTKADDRRTAELFKTQEEAYLDEISSNPVLDRVLARKSKSKLNRLLKILDSLPQGEMH